MKDDQRTTDFTKRELKRLYVEVAAFIAPYKKRRTELADELGCKSHANRAFEAKDALIKIISNATMVSGNCIPRSFLPRWNRSALNAIFARINAGIRIDIKDESNFCFVREAPSGKSLSVMDGSEREELVTISVSLLTRIRQDCQELTSEVDGLLPGVRSPAEGASACLPIDRLGECVELLRTLWIDALRTLAELKYDLGQLTDAQRDLEAVLAAAPNDVEALNTQGRIFLDRGQRARAERTFNRASELADERTEIWLRVQNNIAVCRRQRHEYRSALSIYRRIAHRFQQRGDDYRSLQVRINIADTCLTDADLEGALREADEVQRAATEKGFTLIEGHALHTKAMCHLRDEEQLPAARVELQDALERYRREARPQSQIRALSNLGYVQFLLNETVAARKALSEALTMARTIEYAEAAAVAEVHLGEVAIRCNDFDEADERLRSARTTFDKLDRVEGIGYVAYCQAAALWSRNLEAARKCLGEAKEIFASEDLHDYQALRAVDHLLQLGPDARVDLRVAGRWKVVREWLEGMTW